MARFKVEYSYGKKPAGGSVIGPFGSHDNVIYQWKNDELEFPDENSAMAFFNKIVDSWENEEIYEKDRLGKLHYRDVVVKAFQEGKWVPVKSANYEQWFKANKERKFAEKAKQQQPADTDNNVMENKKNMKKQIKLHENELRKIVVNKVRESLNEFYGIEDNMFRRNSDTKGVEPATQPQANMEEDTKAQRKKDPLNQAFQDMEKAQKFRDTMDKIYDKDKKPLKESQFRKIVENKVRGMLKEMFEEEGGPFDPSEEQRERIIRQQEIFSKQITPKESKYIRSANGWPGKLGRHQKIERLHWLGWTLDEVEQQPEEIQAQIWGDLRDGNYKNSKFFKEFGAPYQAQDNITPQVNEPTVAQLNESQFRKIVENKVRGMLKEMFMEEPNNPLVPRLDMGPNNPPVPGLDDESNFGEYDFYVAADTDSEYFKTYDEAYNYAKSLAEKETDWYEPIDIMDNRNWQTITRFDENGEHDCNYRSLYTTNY